MRGKDLRRCPFCGGEGQVVATVFDAQVVCLKCGARGAEAESWDEAKDPVPVAIELWNRRIVDNRAQRPYDAMGDDQGRGETGDGWYQENFKEAEAYKK